MTRWLVIPLWLAGAGLLFAAFLRARTLFLVALAIALVTLPVVWILVSALSAARPDRTCPACGEEKLEPLSPGAEVGVRCRRCNHIDEAASTALLDYEAEGPET